MLLQILTNVVCFAVSRPRNNTTLSDNSMMDCVYDLMKETNKNEAKTAHSWKISAEQSDMEAQLHYAWFLEHAIRGKKGGRVAQEMGSAAHWYLTVQRIKGRRVERIPFWWLFRIRRTY
jgi:hypothetical protein